MFNEYCLLYPTKAPMGTAWSLMLKPSQAETANRLNEYLGIPERWVLHTNNQVG